MGVTELNEKQLYNLKHSILSDYDINNPVIY